MTLPYRNHIPNLQSRFKITELAEGCVMLSFGCKNGIFHFSVIQIGDVLLCAETRMEINFLNIPSYITGGDREMW